MGGIGERGHALRILGRHAAGARVPNGEGVKPAIAVYPLHPRGDATHDAPLAVDMPGINAHMHIHIFRESL